MSHKFTAKINYYHKLQVFKVEMCTHASSVLPLLRKVFTITISSGIWFCSYFFIQFRSSVLWPLL